MNVLTGKEKLLLKSWFSVKRREEHNDLIYAS
jgi:hypothetical protein